MKSFRDLASDAFVASEAFVSFCEEHDLFDNVHPNLSSYLSGIKQSSYEHHIKLAREGKIKAIQANVHVVQMKGALDEHRSKLSGLHGLSVQFQGDEAKNAVQRFIKRYNQTWSHGKISYWLESVALNAVGAGVGLIVVYFLATFLASNGFSGLELKTTPAPVNSASMPNF